MPTCLKLNTLDVTYTCLYLYKHQHQTKWRKRSNIHSYTHEHTRTYRKKNILQYYIWKIKPENEENERKERKEMRVCVCDEGKWLRKRAKNDMRNMKKHIKNMVME